MTNKHIEEQMIRQGSCWPLWSPKIVFKSAISNRPLESNRSYKFIPAEFRDKHLTQKPFLEPQVTEKYHNNLSFIGQSTKERKQDYARKRNRIEKRRLTLQETRLQMPKLRETNSTLCQSPKALNILVRKEQDFKRLRLLGKGKFGEVFLVKHIKSGFLAALKVIRKSQVLGEDDEESQKALQQLIREIKLQAFLVHPNLIQLYDFFSDSQNIYMLVELACDGHLFGLLRNSKISEESTSILIREITQGVDFMHRHQIIHRDIKLENIVLSHGMAKICDFGWSVYCPREFRSTLCGTPLYLSPEILKGKKYNQKIDTWAIGALAHELVTAENPFKIRNNNELSRIITEDFVMETGSPELRSFITFILKKNSVKRPDTDTILRHPFIKKYEDFETSEEICRITYKHK